MKKFMKKLAKKAEGFTLVELIVVIAILGILAGIAVPAYSGYLKKANYAADEQVVAYANTIIQSGFASIGETANATEVTGATITSKALVVTVTDDAARKAMYDFAGLSGYAADTNTISFSGMTGDSSISVNVSGGLVTISQS